MTRRVHSDVAESNQSLWALTVAPVIWLLYFLLAYIVYALRCGALGRDGSLGTVGAGFTIATVLALAGIAAAGWGGWRRYRHDSGVEAVPSHHRDTPEDRHRFLGLATFLLSTLSAIATVYTALAMVMVRSCG